MARVAFVKYQALGNDYLVFEGREIAITPERARFLTDRNFGVGADGVLLREPGNDARDFRLRIFNPDGSEAEKSGNGIRIFARYLYDRGDVGESGFQVQTPGGEVSCRVEPEGAAVQVEMGRVSFESQDIPVTGKPRAMLRESLDLGGESLEISCANIGNPHCVVFRTTLDEAELRRLGPRIEHHPHFPQRTNVQFARVRGRANLEIRIWERGAGYTLASGSSASAAAAVAHRLGLCDAALDVHMPGGVLAIEIGPDYGVRMTGPATRVFAGEIELA